MAALSELCICLSSFDRAVLLVFVCSNLICGEIDRFKYTRFILVVCSSRGHVELLRSMPKDQTMVGLH